MKKILLILVMILCTHRALAQGEATEESVKAAFLFHFINYTEWSSDDQNTPYYVCIPDDESLRDTARQVLQNKQVNNRDIVVASKTQGCHILVSESTPHMDETITVGSLNDGALFEFRIIENKLKFAVNLEKVKKSKLKISSQLLKLAILDENS